MSAPLLIILGGVITTVAYFRYRRDTNKIYVNPFRPQDTLRSPGPIIHAAGSLLILLGVVAILVREFAQPDDRQPSN